MKNESNKSNRITKAAYEAMRVEVANLQSKLDNANATLKAATMCIKTLESNSDVMRISCELYRVNARTLTKQIDFLMHPACTKGDLAVEAYPIIYN